MKSTLGSEISNGPKIPTMYQVDRRLSPKKELKDCVLGSKRGGLCRVIRKA